MLVCGCDFDDQPTLYRSMHRRARQDHRCQECRQTIRPGNTYRHERVLDSGFWDTFKTCERCDDLWGSLEALGFCRFTGGVLRDAYREYLDEYVATRYDEGRDEYLTPTGLTADEAFDRAFPVGE